MDVIFGGIVIFGLENLVSAIAIASERSFWAFLTQAYAAAAVYSFLIYDVLVYHLNVRDLPYRWNLLGAVRFFIDIVMAFTLMLVVVPVCRSAESAAASVVFGVIVWHSAAAIWHVVAMREHERGWPAAEDLCSHFGAALVYGLVVALVLYLGDRPISLANLNAVPPLLVVCTLLIVFAVFRTSRRITLFRRNRGKRREAAA